jgi:hypothetical protein
MDIQINIERAIHQLVDEFLGEPYRFFTEAEAVSRFHHLLEADPILNLRVKSRDGIPLSMIHQEYPTFFRFDDIAPAGSLGAQPIARLDAARKDQRGHYDIVLLTPEFIKKHSVETIKNRELANERIKHIQPFQAVVEFKLEDRAWNSGTTKGATAELGKLILSRDEADLRYFVGLMRYTAPTENRWNKYWPEVTQAAMANMDIKSIFATYRVAAAHPPHVQSIGDWCVKYEEKKKLPQRQN